MFFLLKSIPPLSTNQPKIATDQKVVRGKKPKPKKKHPRRIEKRTSPPKRLLPTGGGDSVHSKPMIHSSKW